MSVRVNDRTHETFTERAHSHGLSVNQYLKLLILRELGEAPPPKASQAALQDWLRGK